jgi:hypothetical protein
MQRASEHVRELNREIKIFFDAEPYELIHEFDPDPPKDMFPPGGQVRGAHLYRVNAAPVPDRFSILAGDVIRDLRSALDYLAWQLALVYADPPPERTEFPIFKDKAIFDKRHKRLIGGIDPELHPKLERIQPFNAMGDAEKNPLWVLHRMANDYKHRLPRVVASLPTGVGLDAPKGVHWSAFGRAGPFEPEDIVLGYAITSGAEPEQEFDFKTAFAVALRNGSEIRPPLGDDLDKMGREVAGIINWFRGSIPE